MLVWLQATQLVICGHPCSNFAFVWRFCLQTLPGPIKQQPLSQNLFHASAGSSWSEPAENVPFFLKHTGQHVIFTLNRQ